MNARLSKAIRKKVNSEFRKVYKDAYRYLRDAILENDFRHRFAIAIKILRKKDFMGDI